ncbi:hypothetical protein FQN60_005370, partial [Etheostoma spectabile]
MSAKAVTFMGALSDGELLGQNKKIISGINVGHYLIETAFGRLKGRWRCLLKRNDCKLELSKKMTLTCCVLHNI